MTHPAPLDSWPPRLWSRPPQAARPRRPKLAHRKPPPRPFPDARKEDFRDEILRWGHTHTPAKAVVAFLGTGWQRFRFLLGRPRAAAHVWGKGARILTEINRLPHLHLLAPKKLGVESSPVQRLRTGSGPFLSRPLLVPIHSIRRRERCFRRMICPCGSLRITPETPYRSGAFWPRSCRSVPSSHIKGRPVLL
jgi:hypothetical protein